MPPGLVCFQVSFEELYRQPYDIHTERLLATVAGATDHHLQLLVVKSGREPGDICVYPYYY